MRKVLFVVAVGFIACNNFDELPPPNPPIDTTHNVDTTHVDTTLTKTEIKK